MRRGREQQQPDPQAHRGQAAGTPTDVRLSRRPIDFRRPHSPSLFPRRRHIFSAGSTSPFTRRLLNPPLPLPVSSTSFGAPPLAASRDCLLLLGSSAWRRPRPAPWPPSPGPSARGRAPPSARLPVSGADWGLPARCQVSEWGTRNTSWDWPLRLHQLLPPPRFSGADKFCAWLKLMYLVIFRIACLLE